MARHNTACLWADFRYFDNDECVEGAASIHMLPDTKLIGLCSEGALFTCYIFSQLPFRGANIYKYIKSRCGRLMWLSFEGRATYFA